jgi:hypothetical protein
LGSALDLTLAVLNGLVGDHLVRTNNGLATELELYQDGEPLRPTRRELATKLRAPTSKVVVLVHGLMCTETIFQMPDGADYGSLLERDLGYTALRVRYNTGRAVVENGALLSALVERVVEAYPVPIEELSFIGFSMGGLVVRGLCHTAHQAGLPYLPRLKRAIYVGTPHRGAPLERGGRVLSHLLRRVPDPYARLAADLADLRSEGVRDLGDADLRHEDRALSRATPRFSLRDPRHPVPLLDSIEHYLVAGTIWDDPQLALWFGDSLVPVPSATGHGCAHPSTVALPPSHLRILNGFSHTRLAHDPLVYEAIRAWCSPSQETENAP